MAARDTAHGPGFAAEHARTNHDLIVSALARGRVDSEDSDNAPTRARRHPYRCSVCGAADVADVTDGADEVAMGLCANGHVVPLERAQTAR
jgi:hypothetical protein